MDSWLIVAATNISTLKFYSKKIIKLTFTEENGKASGNAAVKAWPVHELMGNGPFVLLSCRISLCDLLLH